MSVYLEKYEWHFISPRVLRFPHDSLTSNVTFGLVYVFWTFPKYAFVLIWLCEFSYSTYDSWTSIHSFFSFTFDNYINTSKNDVVSHMDTHGIAMALVQITTWQWWYGIHNEVLFLLFLCHQPSWEVCSILHLHETSALFFIFTIQGGEWYGVLMWSLSSNFRHNLVSFHSLVQWSTCIYILISVL